ncbi:MAG TPA: hypothetical protein VIU11_22890 [Nakamurella sp.]
MSITPSELRADIYRLLDQVISTGVPLEVMRNGRLLRIAVEPPPSKLDHLMAHPDYVRGDPEELIEMDWSTDWNPEPN